MVILKIFRTTTLIICLKGKKKGSKSIDTTVIYI